MVAVVKMDVNVCLERIVEFLTRWRRGGRGGRSGKMDVNVCLERIVEFLTRWRGGGRGGRSGRWM